eukprot:Skav209996  [mRNA]  locus=scaffold3061:67577:70225:- [translate_table: standard]
MARIDFNWRNFGSATHGNFLVACAQEARAGTAGCAVSCSRTKAVAAVGIGGVGFIRRLDGWMQRSGARLDAGPAGGAARTVVGPFGPKAKRLVCAGSRALRDLHRGTAFASLTTTLWLCSDVSHTLHLSTTLIARTIVAPHSPGTVNGDTFVRTSLIVA